MIRPCLVSVQSWVSPSKQVLSVPVRVLRCVRHPTPRGGRLPGRVDHSCLTNRRSGDRAIGLAARVADPSSDRATGSDSAGRAAPEGKNGRDALKVGRDRPAEAPAAPARTAIKPFSTKPLRRLANCVKHGGIALLWDSHNPPCRDGPMIPQGRPDSIIRQGHRPLRRETGRGLSDGTIRRVIAIDPGRRRAATGGRVLPDRGPAATLGRARDRGARRVKVPARHTTGARIDVAFYRRGRGQISGRSARPVPCAVMGLIPPANRRAVAGCRSSNGPYRAAWPT